MLARIRRNTGDKDQGFTLIELLVVMIIIGILAAIAIPAFLSQKNKAKETSAKADVSSIGKEIAAYYVDGASTMVATSVIGTSWTLTSGDGQIINGKLSAGNTVTPDGTPHVITNGDKFCVAVFNSAAGSSPWKYSAKFGLAKGACLATDL